MRRIVENLDIWHLQAQRESPSPHYHKVFLCGIPFHLDFYDSFLLSACDVAVWRIV